MARVVVVVLPFIRMIVMTAVEVQDNLMRSEAKFEDWKVTNVRC